MSRKPDNAEKDEVTLASSAGGNVPARGSIIDDDTTSHDTTTHERRRHQIKPIERGSDLGDRARVQTLRSVDSVKRPRSRWLWALVVLCLGAGALVAWRTRFARSSAKPKSSAPSAATTAASAESSVPEAPRLWLDLDVDPSTARVQIDGKPIEKTRNVELELPCPKGFHELRVEAEKHETVTKRIPCEGRIVMDVTLDER